MNNSKENADTSAIYFADSKLQTKDEFDQNKKADTPKEDNTFAASADEDSDPKLVKAAGTDRAGTAERKAFGDTALNKGLEAQAKDEEA